MWLFCFDSKKVKVIDEPENFTQTLKDALEKGQKIVEVDCPFCIQ
jgi:hypothetical protein